MYCTKLRFQSMKRLIAGSVQRIMTKNFRKIVWNKSLRCIFATAVLFYALFPQTGFCVCPGCKCSNKLPTSEAVTHETTEGCCCHNSKAEPVQEPSCCPEKSDENSSDNCSCSCSETKLPPPPVQKTGGQMLQELDHSKDFQSTPSMFSPFSGTLSEIVCADKTFETPISRLPVRLHLMLHVLLN